MGKYIVSFFLLSSIITSLSAQDPLAHSQKILNNLIRATGNIYPNVALKIIDTKTVVASSKALNYEISLEKGAYDICMKLAPEKQDAALAFILGHELAHIYHHHGKSLGFVKEFSASTIHTLEEDTIESQADEYGFFYARVAGYSTTGIEEDLFNALYTYLEKQSILPLPPKEGRIQMAKANSRKVQPYIDLFRLAEKLMIEEDYSDAASIYHYILLHLTSPEIYLNTAVAEILYAKSIQNDTVLTYTFPLLFDTESQSERGKEVESKEKEVLIILQQADSLLQIVCEKYKPYSQATFYAAYNHYLQSLQNKNFSLEKDRQIIDVMAYDDSLLQPYQRFLQGILMAAMGKKAEALRIFQDKNIQTHFPAEAAENSYILQSQKRYEPAACMTEIAVEDENINGTNQLTEECMKDAIVIHLYNPYEKDSLHIYIKNIPKHCNYYQVKGKKNFQFIETEKGYSQSTTTGLHIGSPAKSIIAKCGQPCQKVSLPTTEFYRYNFHRQIVFRIKAGKIVSWYLYSIR